MLRLRFIDELTQPEIGERLGISRSYVSRLIRTATAKIKTDMDADTTSNDVADRQP